MALDRRRLLGGLAALLSAGPAWAEPAVTAGYAPQDRALIAEALQLPTSVVARLNDTAVTELLLTWARTEAGQRVRPSAVDARWTVEPRRRDLANELAHAREEGRLADWLATIPDHGPQADALRRLRARYADIVGVGGWRAVPSGPPVRPGDRGPAVMALRNRLLGEGYGGLIRGDAELFDADLEAALRLFQADHMLDVDGVVGPSTRNAMNVTAAERLQQIDANLERRRWLPAELPSDRLEVDTGGGEAVLYRAGAPALRMRLIMGDPTHETPMFASKIDGVVFNPPWNVPDSIAERELLPAERKSPGLLARMGIRWVDGRLQQAPGPKNSLGVVKFDMPSPFGVYLHDTPAKALFDRPVRAFSHGCMRLEKPMDLAVDLLAPQGISRASADAAVATGETRRVQLARSMPVFVLHWTVRANDDGGWILGPDVYGWDRKLTTALAASDLR